jgi:hypothetical protein
MQRRRPFREWIDLKFQQQAAARYRPPERGVPWSSGYFQASAVGAGTARTQLRRRLVR